MTNSASLAVPRNVTRSPTPLPIRSSVAGPSATSLRPDGMRPSMIDAPMSPRWRSTATVFVPPCPSTLDVVQDVNAGEHRDALVAFEHFERFVVRVYRLAAVDDPGLRLSRECGVR